MKHDSLRCFWVSDASAWVIYQPNFWRMQHLPHYSAIIHFVLDMNGSKASETVQSTVIGCSFAIAFQLFIWCRETKLIKTLPYQQHIWFLRRLATNRLKEVLLALQLHDAGLAVLVSIWICSSVEGWTVVPRTLCGVGRCFKRHNGQYLTVSGWRTISSFCPKWGGGIWVQTSPESDPSMTQKHRKLPYTASDHYSIQLCIVYIPTGSGFPGVQMGHSQPNLKRVEHRTFLMQSRCSPLLAIGLLLVCPVVKSRPRTWLCVDLWSMYWGSPVVDVLPMNLWAGLEKMTS